MPKSARRLLPEDILPTAEYEKIRQEKKSAIIPVKQRRRVEVGPYATFYFENYDTMWLQVQEMVRIEKGGAEQIAGEIEAYNPLIPQGNELVATMMFEIDDPVRRANVLKRLGGVEETVFIDFGGGVPRIAATFEQDVERTAEDGKTSAVHFLRFAFTPDQIARFKDAAATVILGIGHENYAHMAVVSSAVRAQLGEDFA